VKLERATLTVLSAPVEDPVQMSFSQLSARNMVLVELEADGVTGLGESWVNYPAWAASERLATLEHGVLPLLADLDVSDPAQVQRDLLARLAPVARQWGAPGPVWQALSAVDIALWDLRARTEGVPVAALLADVDPGPASQVPVYASGVGPAGVEKLCAAALEAGISAVKARVGFGRERDEVTLSRVREAVLAGTQLLVDANQAWSVEQAAEFCDWAAGYGVTWLEEPVADNHLDDLCALRRRVEVPLACGENLYGLEEFGRYADSGAIGMIQPDLTKSGGFTVATGLMARLPEGVVVSPHSYGGGIVTAASVHLAAAYPAAAWVELDVHPNPLRDALVRDRFRARDGVIEVPTEPGLGVDLDRDVMDRYLVDRRECELRGLV
jgi:D-galactarolactone cycloisomerase